MNMHIKSCPLNLALLFFLVIITSSVFSCAEIKLPECITEKEKDISISWGTINNKSKIKTFYKLTADAKIYKIIEDSMSIQESSYRITIKNDEFCDIKSQMMKLILQKQAIHFPADEQQFLEFSNKSKNIYFAAAWNPEFTNVGNKELRVFFDFLNSRLKQK